MIKYWKITCIEKLENGKYKVTVDEYADGPGSNSNAYFSYPYEVDEEKAIKLGFKLNGPDKQVIQEA